jgi:hypothetical protein
MNTLRNIAIGIIGTFVFALAVRIGFHAEQAAAAQLDSY